MRNIGLHSQLESLQTLFDRATTASLEDPELVGHWGRYLCIMTAGFLQNAPELVYSDYISKNANLRVQKFARQNLGRINNPKANKFVEIAGSFDKDWAQSLNEYLEEDNGHRRNAIDSVMANRNQIVHGGTTSISVGRIREYLSSCVEAVEFIENQTS